MRTKGSTNRSPKELDSLAKKVYRFLERSQKGRTYTDMIRVLAISKFDSYIPLADRGMLTALIPRLESMGMRKDPVSGRYFTTQVIAARKKRR